MNLSKTEDIKIDLSKMLWTKFLSELFQKKDLPLDLLVKCTLGPNRVESRKLLKYLEKKGVIKNNQLQVDLKLK